MRSFNASSFRFRYPRRARFDQLEARMLLSASPSGMAARPIAEVVSTSTTSPSGFTPGQISRAYGFDQITMPPGASPNGTGQTIAIVVAYDDPHIAGDLTAFDQQFNLPAAVLSKVYASGSVPDTNSGWTLETSLDVEWAHAIAPAANIVIVEAQTSNIDDLMAAVDAARNLPDVTTVSMSWGSSEFSGETDYDDHFTTPAGHPGITFIAASGDHASPGLWPAFVPNVLSVGGSTLTLADGTYGSETGWAESGGGASQYETEPSYQTVVQSGGSRESPDVAYNSDFNTGYSVYNSANSTAPWEDVSGTSAAAPQWAALVAIADQGRALLGEGPLDGVQSALYQLPASDFHDITSGNNGHPATAGYDLVTGLGSPVANFLVPDLIDGATTIVAVNTHTGSGQAATVGQAFSQPLTLTIVDQHGVALPDVPVTLTAPAAGASASFPNGSSFTTDASGQVSVTVMAGTLAGNYTVTASVAGLAAPVAFQLTNTPGSAAKIVAISGSTQPATIGSAFQQPLVVAVTDSYGNSVPGVTVAFTAPTTGASATFTGGAQSATDDSGRASVSASANSLAGEYVVDATVSGVTGTADFALTNGPANTTTAVGATPAATAVFGQTVSFTATVSADVNGLGVPTGDVTFYDGDTILGSSPLAVADGVNQAVLTTSAETDALAIGSHLITARYSGDTNFLTSSDDITENIAPLPTSSVASLNGISLSTFSVAWSGSDVGGPGLAGYDILVSDNGGPFTTWLTATTQISALFQGIFGHTYGFTSVAIDALGNRQPLAAAAQATTVALATDNNSLYVAAVYEQVLGRPPEATGLGYWTSLLDRGDARSSVAAAIVHSTEYDASEVVRPAYLKYLGREADDAGVAFWTAKLQGGMSDQEFEASLAASDEFYLRSGGTNAAWLAALYQTMLGRPIDAAAQSYFAGQLSAGVSRGQIAAAVATSQEHDMVEITANYQRYLHRSPEANGLTYWLEAFGQGASNEDLITGFVGSAEFYNQSLPA